METTHTKEAGLTSVTMYPCYRRRKVTLLIILMVTLVSIYLFCCTYRMQSGIPAEDAEKIRQIYSQKTIAIPKIVHLMWKDATVPTIASKWVREWTKTNPGLLYWFWTDKAIKEFIAARYPEYLTLYNSYESHIERSDVARYFILFEFGGLYADIDIQPLKSLDSIFSDYFCLLSQEPEVHFKILSPAYCSEETSCSLAGNALMACRPKHPYFLEVIENLQTFKIQGCRAVAAVDCTGPGMITKTLVRYKNMYGNHLKPKDDVIIAPSELFMPVFDPARFRKVVQICSNDQEKKPKFQSELCGKLKAKHYRNVVSKNSLTVHRWLHSWTPERGQMFMPYDFKPDNIKKVLPSVHIVNGATVVNDMKVGNIPFG